MKRLSLQPPVYWVVEKEATGSPIGIGWFIHTEWPYYRGKSLRVRVGGTAVEFGLCRKVKAPPKGVYRDLEDVDVDHISDWVGPRDGVQVEEDQGDGGGSPEVGEEHQPGEASPPVVG